MLELSNMFDIASFYSTIWMSWLDELVKRSTSQLIKLAWRAFDKRQAR